MDGLLQILIIGGLFFLMMRFGCGSHMFGRGQGSKHNKGAGAKSGGGCCGGGHADKDKHETTVVAEQEQESGGPPENDTDPVCGMEVQTKTAKTSLHEGLIYFFCSQDCRETFEAAPEKYLGRDLETEPPQLEH